jgi:hypothetical protein
MEENLKEYVNIHIKEWNQTQKDLWLKLVDIGIVEKNDTIVFMKFSNWFNVFFLEHNYYPSVEETVNYATLKGSGFLTARDVLPKKNVIKAKE